MNPSDWNWFYSSLAQSAAALVGVFGAFLVSFFMSYITEFNRLLSQITKVKNKIEYQKTRNSLCDYNAIAKNNRELVKNSEEFKKYMQECYKQDSFTRETFFSTFQFSIFDDPDNIFDEFELLINKEFEERRKNEIIRNEEKQGKTIQDLYESLRERSCIPHTLSIPNDTVFLLSAIERQTHNGELNQITHSLLDSRQLIYEVKEIITNIDTHQRNKNIFSASSSLVFLIFSSVVIVPLFLIPVGEIISNLSNIKILLIIIFFLGISIPLLLLTIKVVRNSFDKGDIEYLKKHLAFSEYNEYFKNIDFEVDKLKYDSVKRFK